ncbi:DUF5691 domain-containing protein [Caulobacter endophyticus]|uniref:Uncharacterized protein n=1 Tax=Caulobacter endophyticus TaxID=2172652 RepID=A0A2T9JIC8_9CAUL|nr:DUF5691 domain-containing protein [Caulobacter endophyticus]PVM83444.1 hypothetical protein DDF67_21160 [Caulobacter endophyticus]
MLELEDHLARIRGAWMAGRAAVDHAPAAWRDAVGTGGEAEAALVALTGQALQVLFRPVAPPLAARDLLPSLPMPTPPEAARARIRRVLAARRSEEGGARFVVQLLAARGYVMHPADWLPRASDDWAPDVYAPWIDWAAAETAGASSEALTADSWNDWPWARRRVALTALRRSDPAAARALVAAKAGGEPAERRLRVLEVLEVGLSADDAAVLGGFASDRSDRVRGLVRRLLSRLGRGEGEGDAEPAQELAAMVELGCVGLIKRRHQLKLKPLKNPIQEGRRRALMGVVTLAALAKALGVDEKALVESVPVGEPWAISTFMGMVEETAAPEAWRALFDLALHDAAIPLDLVAILARRAPADERRNVLPTILEREDGSGFRGALAVAGEVLGHAGPGPLARSLAYKELFDLIGPSLSAEARTPPLLAVGLNNLGLLLDQAGARSVVEACAAAGLSIADPRLDLLHLNIALNPERPT